VCLSRRRALQEQVTLCSSNGGCASFISLGGPIGYNTSHLPPSEPERPRFDSKRCASLDFVLIASDDSKPLYSNHKGCSHFMLPNGLCSVPLANSDIVWMEGVAQVPPGTIFKAFRCVDQGSISEYSYDPLTRYHGLGKSVRRRARGEKSPEHLENLRCSDPLINLSAWHDLRELYASIRTTAAYQDNQAGFIRRGLIAHARKTSTYKHLEASLEVDATFHRGERHSSDSVMVMDPVGILLESPPPEDDGLEDASCESSPVGIEAALCGKMQFIAAKQAMGKGPKAKKAHTFELESLIELPASSVY